MDCVDCDDHQDFFQNGHGHPATSPPGIRDAEFSDFYRPIFEHLRELAPSKVEKT